MSKCHTLICGKYKPSKNNREREINFGKRVPVPARRDGRASGTKFYIDRETGGNREPHFSLGGNRLGIGNRISIPGGNRAGTGNCFSVTGGNRAGTGNVILIIDREGRDRARTGTSFPPNSVTDHKKKINRKDLLRKFLNHN